MTQHPNSLANLNHKSHPVGYKQKIGKYWRVKLSDGRWEYVHKVLAEQQLGRPLNPDERVYFVEGVSKSAYKDPQPGDIEVRKVVPTAGKPPGRRSSVARRVIELRARLAEAEAHLASLNEFYGRPKDDISDAAKPREWKGK
jgi:hypothetical protein